MPYCTKCGGNVDETNFFCTNCGAALKFSSPNQTEPAHEELEKQQTSAKATPRIHEKNRHGQMTYLISGLILVTLGVFGILFLTDRFLATAQSAEAVLVIIGVVIISGAIYIHYPGGKMLQETKQSP